MAEWRTQEQIDADEALHQAVARVLVAYDEDDGTRSKFMLTDYVVITASVGMTDDKAQNTTYDYVLANGSVPWHVMMGLMDWGYMTMKDTMRNSKEDGD